MEFDSVFKYILLGGSDGKESVCNARDPGSITGMGRSPGEGDGNPLQYSRLENSMYRGAWWTIIHGVPKESNMTEVTNTFTLIVFSNIRLQELKVLFCKKVDWFYTHSLSLCLFQFLLGISSCPPLSLHHSTASYWVPGCRGAASPSVMLLDLWFPVKHNESYIRLFWVRWCTICSQACKTGVAENNSYPSFQQNIRIPTVRERQTILILGRVNFYFPHNPLIDLIWNLS